MPDFQERGAHDYRKDATLTIKEFERIIVRCIIYYNSERVIHNYPYSQEMIAAGVPPHANAIWNWKQKEEGANLINVSKRDLILTLLPRTTGKFTRSGLKVNGLRYFAGKYTEQFLKGGDATVAYNPDNCSNVWVKESNGSFVEFTLVESRFEAMPFEAVYDIKDKQKHLEKEAAKGNCNAKIDLLSYIETVSQKEKNKPTQIKGVRIARQSEKRKQHKDVGGDMND